MLALIIFAIIALAAFASANRTSSDFVQLTLKQGPTPVAVSHAEAQAKWNASKPQPAYNASEVMDTLKGVALVIAFFGFIATCATWIYIWDSTWQAAVEPVRSEAYLATHRSFALLA